MSEQGLGEGSPPTGTAVRALAAGAATAAATYAFKRALSSRSDNAGHADEDGSRESIRNEREPRGGDEGKDIEQMSAESERDDDQVGELDEGDDRTEEASELGAGRS